MKTKGCVLFLWMLLFLGCDKADISSERYDKLVQAIETKDWELRLRVIHELGQVSKDSLSAQGILIQELFSEDLAPELVDMRFFEVVNALAQTNASTVKKLISACEQRKSLPGDLERLLFVLGRMGPKAKAAVPFLLEQLEKHRNNPDMETFIRIVLANAGYESSENIGQILSALRNGAETGMHALQTLAFVGPGQWVRGDVVRELSEWLAESYDAPYASHDAGAACFLSIPLAAIGQIDHVVGTRLDAFLKAKCAGEDCDERCIWFGFCLAKSTPRQASEALRSALRCLAFASPGHALDGTKVTVGDILIPSDGDLIQDVAGALDDTDPNVVAGVIWLFWRIGLNAQEYAPKVMNILKQSPEEDLRELGARALAYMADPCDIPQLQSIAEREQSEFVRDEIMEAIRILRLEERREELE